MKSKAYQCTELCRIQRLTTRQFNIRPSTDPNSLRKRLTTPTGRINGTFDNCHVNSGLHFPCPLRFQSQSRVTAMHSKFVQWIILCAVPLTSPAIPTPNPVTCRTDEATSRDSSKDKALLINTPKPDQGSFLASKAMEYIFVRRETTMALILMILQLLETPPQMRVLIHQSHCHRFCQ
jgi:hypothetical protein